MLTRAFFHLAVAVAVLAMLAVTNLSSAQDQASALRAPGREFESMQLDEVLARLDRAEAELAALREQRSSDSDRPLTTGPRDLLGDPADAGRAEESMQEAETPSLADRIEALEKERTKQSDAAAKKKADDAKKPTMKLNGRIHADYWGFPETDAGANAFENGDATDSVDDRFLFRRIRVELSGTMPDTMVWRMQVDFNTPSLPQIKDVYLGWEELPYFQTLLVGNQKRPYGLDHLNSSRYNVFMERPSVVEAFNQDARRFGVCSYGVSDDEAYNWRFGAYMGQDMQLLGVVTSTPFAEAYQAELAGRFANTIWYDEASEGRGHAHWAVSGSAARTDGNAGAFSTARFRTRPEARTTGRWEDTGVILDATSYQLLGGEALINTGPLQWVAEYQHVFMQRSVGDDLQFGGAYAYVSYFLTGESMAWDRASGTLGRVKPFENFFLIRTCDGEIANGWGAWQIAARYDHLDLTDDNIAGGVADSWTLGLNWHWSPYTKLQFNYIIGDIDQHRPVDGQTTASYQIIGTRLYCEF